MRRVKDALAHKSAIRQHDPYLTWQSYREQVGGLGFCYGLLCSIFDHVHGYTYYGRQ